MQWIKDFLNLLVDQGCYACGQQLNSQEEYVCLSCLGQMQQTSFHKHPSENELYYRIAGRVDLFGATGLFYFDKKGKLQRLVNAFKYHNAPEIATRLGQLMGYHLKGSAFSDTFDSIIPVPLHPAKARRRGYNQAERIAVGLAEVLEKPVDTTSLIRKRNTRTQTRKSRESRWKNVDGAFAVSENPPQRLLLVDDVITTGATLEACIKTLQAAAEPPKAINIGCIGVARR